MKRIAIIGANGQVGAEVCLFLREHPEVEVVAISRTEVGAAFLRSCGIEPRIGDVSNPADAPRLLDGIDLVADFALPGGSSVEVRRAIRGIVTGAIAAAPPKVPYAYMSSITAFGIPHFRGPLKYYRVSRNQYGASKRYAESLVRKECERAGRRAYVLRLGVVHGELQAVSRQTEREVRIAAGVRTYAPDAPSFTVFVFSIAEALVAIAQGREDPGTYTLVSSPSWSWSDLHQYYASRAAIDGDVALLPDTRRPSRSIRLLPNAAWRLVVSQKDLVGAYLATAFPATELKLRSRYSEKATAADVASLAGEVQYQPYGSNHHEFPGERLRTLTDSRVTMSEPARRVRDVLAGAVDRARKGSL